MDEDNMPDEMRNRHSRHRLVEAFYYLTKIESHFKNTWFDVYIAGQIVNRSRWSNRISFRIVDQRCAAGVPDEEIYKISLWISLIFRRIILVLCMHA